MSLFKMSLEGQDSLELDVNDLTDEDDVALESDDNKEKKPFNLDIKKGGLRDYLGIPKDQKLTMNDIEKALKSDCIVCRINFQIRIINNDY